MLAVQQRGGVSPDAIAMPVELHRGDHVDGLAAAGFTDPEVPFRGVHGRVNHQLAQHVDGDTGVSMPLCVGVPVG
ncbi:MAG: hypothetical protein WA895_22635, partial [Streptosporangiaceae bacterium]